VPKGNYIKIEQLKILENRLLLYKLSCSPRIKKYFLSNSLYVKYDDKIPDINLSILFIPAVSSLITLAWAFGADIHVKELDKTYLESLEKIKSVMIRWFPKFTFSTNIDVEKIVPNTFCNDKYGLLFSGGVDSTASYIRNRDKRPNLIMIWGQDIPLNQKTFWRRVRDTYKQFADQENLGINFIETNMRYALYEELLSAKFGRYTLRNSWWVDISHGIWLLGMCAPLTLAEPIGTILIAATYSRHQAINYPHGSHPLIDNKMSWANVKVVHDGDELSRQQKIKLIKNYIRTTHHHPFLRVCWSIDEDKSRDLNCTKCEKCLRTVTGLVLENVDPQKCGFNVDKNCFVRLKQSLEKNKLKMTPTTAFFYWADIQKHIPKTINHNMYNSKQFFRWFKFFDISRCVTKRSGKLAALNLAYLYHRLPKNIQSTHVRHLYYIALACVPRIIEALSACVSGIRKLIKP